MKNIEYKNLHLNINDFFEEVNEVPEGMNIDLSKTKIFSYGMQGSYGLLLLDIKDMKDAMPFDDKEFVIESIHSFLQDNQGLIEVGNGTTITGKQYIYSIVKTGVDEINTQYTSVCHIDYKDFVLSITGFYEENGSPGFRESMVFNMLDIKPGDVWAKDPYDKDFKKGILMNLAEDKEYDKIFSNHPLTIARKVFEDFFDNN